MPIVYWRAEPWRPLVVGDQPASLCRGQLSPSPVLRSGALLTAGGLTRQANDQTVRLLRQAPCGCRTGWLGNLDRQCRRTNS
jgi:hypothetical protein